MRALVLLATLAIAGCCDQSVTARAFVGHKSLEECRKLLRDPETPVSIVCPGTEVTVCWETKGATETKVTVSPDPAGVSGTKGTTGAVYFTPKENTTVDVFASECASTVKQVQVITGPTPATFDAGWDAKCSQITYSLDPAFVDPKVQAIDVTAEWDATVSDGAGGVFTCATPPFLDGAHPIESYFFKMDRGFLTVPFTRVLKATKDWNYTFKACQGLGFKCNPYASLPFDMTLTCPSS